MLGIGPGTDCHRNKVQCVFHQRGRDTTVDCRRLGPPRGGGVGWGRTPETRKQRVHRSAGAPERRSAGSCWSCWSCSRITSGARPHPGAPRPQVDVPVAHLPAELAAAGRRLWPLAPPPRGGRLVVAVPRREHGRAVLWLRAGCDDRRHRSVALGHSNAVRPSQDVRARPSASPELAVRRP